MSRTGAGSTLDVGRPSGLPYRGRCGQNQRRLGFGFGGGTEVPGRSQARPGRWRRGWEGGAKRERGLAERCATSAPGPTASSCADTGPASPLTTLDPHPPLSVAYPQLPSPLSFQKQTQQTGAESLRSLVCQCPRAAVTSSCKLGGLKQHKLIWWLWAPEVLSELWALENPLPFLFQLLVTVPSPSPL